MAEEGIVRNTLPLWIAPPVISGHQPEENEQLFNKTAAGYIYIYMIYLYTLYIDMYCVHVYFVYDICMYRRDEYSEGTIHGGYLAGMMQQNIGRGPIFSAVVNESFYPKNFWALIQLKIL